MPKHLASHVRTAVSLASLVTVSATLTSSSTLRAAAKAIFNPFTHPVNFFSLLLALIFNAKSLPLVWHFRFLKIMIFQLYLQPTPLPRDALFRPIVTSSMYTPLPECDYNGHKSNSTYFADCDMARAQLITVLLREGIRNTSKKHNADGRRVDEAAPSNTSAGGTATLPDELPKGKFMVALGAVSCHFKREIKPYERFEIWTRVLSWDRKWVYIVSHLVKAGAVLPDAYALQPWKSRAGELVSKLSKKKSTTSTAPPTEAEKRAEWKSAIFATCISKYVVKKGRLTIPPEIVLENSSLLPPRPGDPTAAEVAKDLPHWTWERVEQERVRGYELAAHFGALDAEGGLHDEFPIGKERDGEDALRLDTLGDFKDLML